MIKFSRIISYDVKNLYLNNEFVFVNYAREYKYFFDFRNKFDRQ